ncbi:germ cell-specific gene 1-like protein isoform X2 [Pygocentrus nattereri]|uniref:germ cell-specific gene 1-like protein isoform X2 n=1 Tax=Pygocentrus nattereri TaxID=42514 RepID=UPI001891780D|nr:germ cell-specific gene 1-like protein isoform X2 [Pygocentrus nattereri]
MGIERGPRATLAFTLNCAAFALAVSAVTTSYWCEGTRKVAKPFCTGPVKVKQTYCIRFNSSDINNTRLVQYIYETGEEKFLMRKFHTGIWFSCEQAVDLIGFTCREFLEITPDHERGVLWLCIVGLFGMVANMMFTTAFQLAVIMGPEDWKPKTWDYSWSYLLAWASFATCMASAVTALNHYTKTIIQFKFKRRNIEKNLRIKQKLLELDIPEGLWDVYLTSDSDPADLHIDLPVNGIKPLCSPVPTALDSQGEEYC